MIASYTIMVLCSSSEINTFVLHFHARYSVLTYRLCNFRHY